MSVSLRKRIICPETVALLYYSDLTAEEWSGVYCPDADGPDGHADNCDCTTDSYFRYRGTLYSFRDFTYIGNPDSAERQAGYIGGSAETVFSAILVSDINHTDDTVHVATWSE